MKVLVYYKISQEGLELLKKSGIEPIISGGEVLWIHDNWASLEKIDASVRNEITVMIGSPMPANEKLIRLLPNLKWIHAAHAGLAGDHPLDWELIERCGISVTTSKVHSTAISEMVVAMILAIYKHIPDFVLRKSEHKYKNPPHQNMLHGKNVLVVGTGNIGKEIGRKLKVGFDMNLSGINSNGHEVEYFDETYSMGSLESLLPKADVVVLSCALTPETTHLIDKNKLALMKPSAIIINIARGKVIVQSDLVEALKENVIAGAGLDVFEVEPIPEDDELWDIPNLLITPHMSGLFSGYDESVIKAFLNNVSFFEKGIPDKMPDYANIKRY